MPFHLRLFVLSKSKFFRAKNGFGSIDVYYQDTDCLFIESKHWSKLQKAGLNRKNSLECRNDYKDGGIFYG